MLIGTMNHPENDVLSEIEWIAEMGFEFVALTLEPPAASARTVNAAAIRAALEDHHLHVVAHELRRASQGRRGGVVVVAAAGGHRALRADGASGHRARPRSNERHRVRTDGARRHGLVAGHGAVVRQELSSARHLVSRRSPPALLPSRRARTCGAGSASSRPSDRRRRSSASSAP